MKRVSVLLFALILVATTVLTAGAVVPANQRIRVTGEAVGAALGMDVPGAAICIVEGGNTLMLEGFGYANIEKEIMVNPDTAFELGELSGLFVSIAVYQLFERGVLDPSDSIEQYLPEAFYDKLDLKYRVELSQLLQGTAGFEERTLDMVFHKDSHRFTTLEEALLAEVPRQVSELIRYSVYSPYSIALAAYVIECVTGTSYEEYVKTQILAPLEMANTILQPTATTRPATMAVGYECVEEGKFAAGVQGGLSYAGLYPATGALSTAADMERLLHFLLQGNNAVLHDTFRHSMMMYSFQNGDVFHTSAIFSSNGNASGVQGKTLCFGASLWINTAEGCGALVLTNTADNGLLALPLALVKTAEFSVVNSTEGHFDLEALCGDYVPAASEGHSFVGKYAAMKRVVKAKLSDGGELTFLDMTLRQIAPGVFADANATGDVPAVQFLMNGEGKVEFVVTADGQVLRPAALWERELPAKILFYAMMGLSIFFLTAGVLFVLWYFLRRDAENAPSLVYTLSLLFAGLTAVFALLQVFVGLHWGSRAFSSAFSALSVCTLVCSIGAMGGLLLAFAVSLTRRHMTARVFRTSLLYVACLLLVNYWGLTVL